MGNLLVKITDVHDIKKRLVLGSERLVYQLTSRRAHLVPRVSKFTGKMASCGSISINRQMRQMSTCRMGTGTFLVCSRNTS